MYEKVLSLDREEQDDIVQEDHYDIPAPKISAIRLIPAHQLDTRMP